MEARQPIPQERCAHRPRGDSFPARYKCFLMDIPLRVWDVAVTNQLLHMIGKLSPPFPVLIIVSVPNNQHMGS